MNHSSLVAVALAAALTGCISQVTTSSRSYLGPEDSGAITAHTPVETAREVTHLLASRGYALVDQQPDGPAGLALKLEKTNVPLLQGQQLGSVVYVWVTPAAAGAMVTMVGKPTYNGLEPCSKDTPGLACSGVSASDDFRNAYMSGLAEADVVHGVLSEMRLEGYVASALPPPAPAPVPVAAAAAAAPDDSCLGQRHAAFVAAAAMTDPEARAKALQRAPECAAAPVTAASAADSEGAAP